MSALEPALQFACINLIDCGWFQHCLREVKRWTKQHNVLKWKVWSFCARESNILCGWQCKASEILCFRNCNVRPTVDSYVHFYSATNCVFSHKGFPYLHYTV